MRVGRGVDKLDRDTYPIAGALDPAFQDGGYAQFAPDFLGRKSCIPELFDGGTGNHS